MIKFNPNKAKKINMTLETQGLDNKKVEYSFIIEIENIKYSFPVSSNGMRLNIDIPKLSEIIKNDIQNGEYKALIEAKIPTENLKGYYVRPWEDNILIESIPKINIKMEESEDLDEEIKLSVSKPIIEEIEDKKEKIIDFDREKVNEYIEEKKKCDKKKSKIGMILGE